MKNILIIFYGKLGDTLVTIPALRVLKAAYPSARITVVSEQVSGRQFVTAADVLGNTGLIERFRPLLIGGSRAARWASRLRLIFELRRTKWDCGIVLMPPHPPMTRDVIAALEKYLKWFGVKRVVSPQSGWTLTRGSDGRLNPLPHVADSLVQMLAPLGIPLPSPGKGDPSLPRRADAAEKAGEILKDLERGNWCLLAVGAGANMPVNRWPIERYASVIGRLASERRVFPILFGSPAEAPGYQQILSGLPRGMMICEQGIEVAAEVLRKCHLYLGNDTGLTHLAAAVGLKCVAVVSARNPPEAWYPYGAGHIVLRTSPACEGCLLTECVEFGMKCLMDISTDQVLASVESLLPAPRS